MKIIIKIIYCIIFLNIISCNRSSNSISNMDIIFPKDSHTILQVNNRDSFLKSITENTFWKSYKPNLPDANSKKILKSITTNPIFIAYTDKDTYFISISKNDTTSIWKNAKNNSIDSTILDKKKWFFTKYENKLIISTSKELKNFSELNKNDEELPIYKLRNTINEECSANLFLDKTQTSLFFNTIFPSKVMNSVLDWSAWDILLEKNKIKLNGSAFIKNDSTLLGTLAKSNPLQSKTSDIIPYGIEDVQFFSFSDVNNLLLKEKITTDFHKYINEVIVFSFQKNKKVVAITSNDINETLKQLFITKEETYQGEMIYSLDDTNDIKLFLSNFTQNISIKNVLLYNSSLIFAENESILKHIINQLKTNVTLSNYLSYNELISNGISNSSYTEVVDLTKNLYFNNKYSSVSKTYKLGLLQITPQKEYLLCNFLSIIPSKKDIPRGSLTEKYNVSLDADAFTTPKWIKNHQTNSKEIIIQDIENKLYLINNKGNILWKKKLNDKINSNIYQVDLYKNGNLQLAFSTEKAIHVLDRNGKEVNPFPIISKESLLPLEIFDYDHNSDYRFVMATRNTIKLVDKKGKEIKGFEKSRVTNRILQTPKHFRINGKDYIVYPDQKGRINILHRTGKDRLSVKETFNFSKNEVFLQNDWLVFTTEEGNQIFIDEKAGARTQNRGFSKGHLITQRYDTEAVISDNKLIINKKTISLPYGIYEKPKIFKIGKIIYISITDLQNNKVHLYTSDGNIVPNFPVFGSSIIDVTIDEGKPLFAFLKDKQTIYVYEF